MIGLDVTMKTLITENFLKDLTLRLGDLGKFLKQINDFYASYYADSDQGYDFPMHDPLAAIFLTNPELFVRKKGRLSVVINGEERGRTLFQVDKNGPHEVCVEVDVKKALDIYKQNIVNKYS